VERSIQIGIVGGADCRNHENQRQLKDDRPAFIEWGHVGPGCKPLPPFGDYTLHRKATGCVVPDFFNDG
jgi:hypothetical protein